MLASCAPSLADTHMRVLLAVLLLVLQGDEDDSYIVVRESDILAALS